MDVPAPTLHDQFLLTRDPRAAYPADWGTLRLAGWIMAFHPSLPVVEVHGSDGPVGWLLGWAVDPEAGLLPDKVLLPGPGAAPSADDIERWLYRFGGRFALAVVNGRSARFYLDPCGTLSAVYSPTQQALASTSTVLRYENWREYARQKAGQRAFRPNQFYPAGLTGDPDIWRLLPNHYLDLETWRRVRHWPLRPRALMDERDTGGIDALVARIVDLVGRTILGVTAHYQGYLGLTAGRDTRMALACARPALDRLRFVTFIYEDEVRRPDIHIARRLAKRFGLDHVGLPLVQPTEAQKEEYLLRVGYVGHWGKARDFDVACRRHLDMDRAWMTGFGGEVGRAFYWRDTDDELHPPSPQELLERLDVPMNGRTLEAWGVWQASLPARDTMELLDRLYIEQRMGCWAGPHMYGTAPFGANLTPFCHREVMEATMSLPAAYRRAQRLADAMAARAWPELSELPYQEFTGMRRVANRAARQTGALVRNAGRALRRTLGRGS